MNAMHMIEQAGMQVRRVDLRGVLPPKAKAKFARLKGQRDEAEALAAVARNRVETIEVTFHTLNDADAAAAREELAELRAKLVSLNARRHMWVVDRLAEWASAKAMAGMTDAPPVKVPSGETVETVRAKIAGIRKELDQTRAAPLTADELKAAAARKVREMALNGRPHVDGRSGDIIWRAEGVSPASLAAWMNPEGMVAALARDIDAVTSPCAMTADARRKRVRELEAALLDAERIEEAIVEATGGTIERRKDADPAAILGVVVGKVGRLAA